MEVLLNSAQHGEDFCLGLFNFQPPLIVAIQTNSIGIVRLLLEHGADVTESSGT